MRTLSASHRSGSPRKHWRSALKRPLSSSRSANRPVAAILFTPSRLRAASIMRYCTRGTRIVLPSVYPSRASRRSSVIMWYSGTTAPTASRNERHFTRTFFSFRLATLTHAMLNDDPNSPRNERMSRTSISADSLITRSAGDASDGDVSFVQCDSAYTIASKIPLSSIPASFSISTPAIFAQAVGV